MIFKEITVREGYYKKTIRFSDGLNIIYSQKNSTGKTTFLRAIYYALGYPIPGTKGIRFDNMEFLLTIESKHKEYKLHRIHSCLTLDDGQAKTDYTLPSDFHKLMEALTGCNNHNILNNLIGASYFDQEKGWTVLNRGKVVGNISFNIEELVRGLGNKDCDDDIKQLEAVEQSLKKYECMCTVGEYQNALLQAGVEVEESVEERDMGIELLQVEQAQTQKELDRITGYLNKNKALADFIAEYKLLVQSDNGEIIPVTKETLVDFADTINYLETRKSMLLRSLSSTKQKLYELEKEKDAEERLFNLQTMIESFDADIKKIRVDPIEAKKVIEQLKKEKKQLNERIRVKTKMDNEVVDQLYACICSYAQELGIDSKYLDPNTDYLFTKDLQSLSGTILYKIVFAFKLAYIKMIREKAGITLPIVLDSPQGREVEHTTVECILGIIQRDYSDHQLIVASIYDYDLQDKNTIVFKERMLTDEDIMTSES